MRINETIYGSGNMDQAAGREYFRGLQVEAGHQDVAARPKSMEEMMRLAGASSSEFVPEGGE